MNDVDKLKQIQAIKTLRKRKAQVTCSRATEKATQIAQRVETLKERHEAKKIAAQGYAERRFMQMSEANDLDLFFTTMTISLLRHRKEVASLGLRITRATHEHTIALRKQRAASDALARATNAEKMISDAFELAYQDDSNAAELDAEEDLIELVNLGGKDRDHQ